MLLSLALGCARGAESSAPRSGEEPAAPAGSFEAASEREPATLAEAEQLLARAQAELDRLALNEPQSPAAGAPAAATASPVPPRDQAERDEKSAAQAEAAPTPPPSPCDNACRAFASLERASDAVCRLDGEDGQRCSRARQIRDGAARRVASCGCS
ncbi:MAG TPA: hypothetical protein VEX18_16945 [Polyangiaceae bacterium]|nr:hypothetical protein [Polyangiaceae bacterium]